MKKKELYQKTNNILFSLFKENKILNLINKDNEILKIIEKLISYLKKIEKDEEKEIQENKIFTPLYEKIIKIIFKKEEKEIEIKEFNEEEWNNEINFLIIYVRNIYKINDFIDLKNNDLNWEEVNQLKIKIIKENKNIDNQNININNEEKKNHNFKNYNNLKFKNFKKEEIGKSLYSHPFFNKSFYPFLTKPHFLPFIKKILGYFSLINSIIIFLTLFIFLINKEENDLLNFRLIIFVLIPLFLTLINATYNFSFKKKIYDREKFHTPVLKIIALVITFSYIIYYSWSLLNIKSSWKNLLNISDYLLIILIVISIISLILTFIILLFNPKLDKEKVKKMINEYFNKF
jgi:hypothetical protein